MAASFEPPFLTNNTHLPMVWEANSGPSAPIVGFVRPDSSNGNCAHKRHENKAYEPETHTHTQANNTLWDRKKPFGHLPPKSIGRLDRFAYGQFVWPMRGGDSIRIGCFVGPIVWLRTLKLYTLGWRLPIVNFICSYFFLHVTLFNRLMSNETNVHDHLKDL